MRFAAISGVFLVASLFAGYAGAAEVDPDVVHLVVDRCGPLPAELLQLCVDLDPAPPVVDVLFMMDLTNSMVQELGILKSEVNSIMAAIRAIPGATDVRFGLISHEDYPGRHISCGYNNIYSPTTESPYRVDAAIGSTDAQVDAAVQAMTLRTGSDGPESYARCLWECGQPDSGINWRAGSVRICLQFGDNIPHDCNLQEGLPAGVTAAQPNTGVDPGRDGIAGTVDDIDWQDDALAAMIANGVTLVSIYSGASGFFPPWPVWAESTGGLAERISTGGVPVGGIPLSELAADMVASVLSEVDLLEFVVDPGCELDIVFDPPSIVGPIDVSMGATVCVEESISVPQAVADNPSISQVQCTVDVLADGQLIGRQMITVDLVDDEMPTIDCPLDIEVGNDAGLCGANVDFEVTAADNCELESVDCTPASGTFFPVGTTQVNCLARDIYGNEANCSFNVIVNDTEAPAIVCNAPIDAGTDLGACGATVFYNTTANDVCDGAIAPACSHESGTVFPVGVTLVTCTATDAAGNSAQCQFEITVRDTEAPTATCPSDFDVPADAGTCTAVVTWSLGAADNCAVAQSDCTPASGSAFPAGVTMVNCTVTDTAGLSDQCSFNVVVRDTEAPVINCPAPISVDNDPSTCGASVPFNVVANDSCDGAIVPVCSHSAGSFFPVGVTVVTCDVSDAAGNPAQCQFLITVIDSQAPTIACPSDIDVPASGAGCTAQATWSLTTDDNCAVANAECTPASGSVFPTGVTVVNCVVTDTAGLSDNCSFNVTVRDTEGPTINCPSDIQSGNDPGRCDARVNFNVTASDSCDGALAPNCAPASGSIFPTGTTQVNCTVSDSSGLSANCSFNVTVRDSTAPSINCPSSINTSSQTGVCGKNVDYGVTADDDCSTPTVVCSPASGSFFPVGVQQVSCTATDASGNVANCSFDVTVTDDEAPSINCPGTVVVNTDPGRCDAVVPASLFNVTADDNCALQSLSCSPAAGSIFAVGTTQVNCTATDVHGNTNQCSFDVRVEDHEQPTVNCGPSLIWPPNHQLVDVGFAYNDNCDTPGELSYAVTVQSDEHPSLILGAGGRIHCPDAVIGEDGRVQVRAERSGSHDGRIYVINYSITDRGGMVFAGVCRIGVPHDQRGTVEPIQSPILYDATGCTGAPGGGGGGQ